MLLLEPTFTSATSLPLSLSHHAAAIAADSPTAAAFDNLDLTLLSSSSSEAKNNSNSCSSEGALSASELNDFNIAQLQLQYETSSMDNTLNMHSITSIDLLNDHPQHHHHQHHHSHLDPDQDIEDSDYAARRMSSSAISSASAQSAQSAHTSSTAPTSHSGYSAQHGQSLKRAQSPGIMDDFDPYDSFDGSPQAKRPRPSLSLESGVGRLGSSSPAPTNTTASAGANNGDLSGSGSGRVQLPPLFSALENTSNSAPPTSHGAQAPFAQLGSQMQHSFSQTSPSSHAMSQGQGQSSSPFPSSNFAFNVTGTGLDLRRGSLPSLYSNSLAVRSAQRSSLPTQGQYIQNQGGSGRYGFSSGMSPGPSPLSSLSAPDTSGDTSGLAGYQFPPPSSLDSGNTSGGSNGSGSTPTPTPNSGNGTGASPFGSGATPTSTLASTPGSTFPQTPLDFAHQHQQHSASYQTAYGQHNQGQKDYLTSGADWGSIGRSSASPSSATNTPASAGVSGGFGFNSNSGLGGLPRISGHAKNNDQQQDWFTPAGQLVLPSPNANNGSSSSNQQHPQTASLSPSPRMHPSSSSSASAATSAAVAAAAALNVSPAAAVQAAQVAAQVAARPARRRGKLPKPTTDFLKDWLHRHSDHPYPSEEEKKQLCHATGLSMSQVSNWMINARRRILAPAQRTPQGPTTTVPSFPLGSTHSSNVARTPLGLSPAHSHGHHGLSSSHHLSHSQSNYGMGMGSGMSNMGLGLIGGLGGSMGYSQQQQAGHQLHSAQGLGMNSGLYAQQQQQQQQYRQQQQAALGHSALYDLGLHAQRRASMPAIALHSQAHLSSGGGGLQLYAPPTTRNSLPGPSPLPQVGYTSQHQSNAYSPSQQGQLASPAAAAPMPQHGYVFPPPSATSVTNGSNNGSGNVDDGR
ncbi:TOS8 [Sanghuangporus weigelae]